MSLTTLANDHVEEQLTFTSGCCQSGAVVDQASHSLLRVHSDSQPSQRTSRRKDQGLVGSPVGNHLSCSLHAQTAISERPKPRGLHAVVLTNASICGFQRPAVVRVATKTAFVFKC